MFAPAMLRGPTACYACGIRPVIAKHYACYNHLFLFLVEVTFERIERTRRRHRGLARRVFQRIACSAPLKPVSKDSAPAGGNLGLGLFAVAVAGAGAIMLMAASTTPCMGATRSTNLEWERRKLLIEQAERDAAAADLQDGVQQPAPADEPNNVEPGVKTNG